MVAKRESRESFVSCWGLVYSGGGGVMMDEVARYLAALDSEIGCLRFRMYNRDVFCGGKMKLESS
jgi:hypothetical protein